MANPESGGVADTHGSTAEIDRILAALALSESFAFYIVVCPNPAVAMGAIETLAARLSTRPVHLEPYRPWDNPEKPISFSFLVERVLKPLVEPAQPGERVSRNRLCPGCHLGATKGGRVLGDPVPTHERAAQPHRPNADRTAPAIRTATPRDPLRPGRSRFLVDPSGTTVLPAQRFIQVSDGIRMTDQIGVPASVPEAQDRREGEVLRAEVERTRALLAEGGSDDAGLQESLAIRLERLARHDHGSGSIRAALARSEEATRVRGMLHERDRERPDWRRSLALSLGRLGEIRRDAGDLAGAQQAHKDAIEHLRTLSGGIPSTRA